MASLVYVVLSNFLGFTDHLDYFYLEFRVAVLVSI